jgi:hypothetical protein
MDMNGKMICSHSHLSSTDFALSTQDIPSGIYFIKIISEHGVIIKKLIIE